MLVFVALVVAVVVSTLVFDNRPNLGLDLRGGVSVVLQPVVKGKAAKTVPAANLEKAKQIIEERVNAIGVAEPDVTVQGKNIVVSIPGIKDQKRALELVGKTAELRFRPVLENLGTVPSKARIAKLRKKLGIPDGVTAEQVYESEAKAREAANPTTTTTSTTTTTASPTTTTTVKGATTSTSTTTSTTTTTIDPTPVNEWGVKVFKNKKGDGNDDFVELLQLEAAAESNTVETTSADDDEADAEVVLPGSEEQDGKVVRYRLGPTALTGTALESASAGLSSGSWTVNPVFRDGEDGIDKFNTEAAKCYKKESTCTTGQMAVVLDSEVISAPSINAESFTRDQVTISGSFTETTAKDLATALNYGALPLTLKAQQVQTVSATLGQGALRAGLIAGAIGLGLVALFLVAYYRMLGLITVASLVLSAGLMWSFIAYLGEHAGLALTLSGIVGIIVSIGVSLDSSVVYFENLKEDVRKGRTVRSAVSGSYTSAFATIVKADVSSLIGAGVLYLLSVGPVRGFALFLFVSTVLDLISSYFFTRPAVALLGRSKFGERPALLGIPVDDLSDGTGSAPAVGSTPSTDKPDEAGEPVASKHEGDPAESDQEGDPVESVQEGDPVESDPPDSASQDSATDSTEGNQEEGN